MTGTQHRCCSSVPRWGEGGVTALPRGESVAMACSARTVHQAWTAAEGPGVLADAAAAAAADAAAGAGARRIAWAAAGLQEARGGQTAGRAE